MQTEKLQDIRHSTVLEAIVIDDDLQVKLFFSGFPIPLPPWFVEGKDC